MKYFLDNPLGKLWPESPSYSFTFDDNGIILINYPETNRLAPGVKERYHPTVIASYALYLYNQYATDNFLKYADWLVTNLISMNGFYAWPFDFEWNAPNYHCTPPWISSMTQGMGLSVLIRAYELTSDPKYSTALDKALTAFEAPISEGGLLRITDGDTWYEGIPSQNGTQILNEALFALIGLHEAEAIELFDKGLATVKKHLKDFDLNLWLFKWSKYDNKRLSYSGDKYHDVHIQQLKWLLEIFEYEDYLLFKTAFKWQRWQNTNHYTKRIFGLMWINIIRRLV